MANPAPKANENLDSDFEGEDVPDSYATPWKEPKKGDSIMGTYLGAKAIPKERGEGTFDAHVLQRADGSLVSAAGGSIDARMDRVPYGTKVKITFQGTQKHKGGNMKLFDVICEKGTKLKPITFTKTREGNDDDLPF